MRPRTRAWSACAAIAFLGGVACDCDGGGGLQGVEGELVLEPEVLDFGEVPVGELVTDVVRIKALGAVTVTLTSLEITPTQQVFLLPDPPPGEVDATGRSVTVAFAPAEAGAFEAQLVVTGVDTRAERYVATLKGAGTTRGLGLVYDGPLCDDPGSASFGNVARGREARLALQVESTGSAPITIKEVALDIGGSEEITLLEPNRFGQVLAPGERLPVTLQYFPADNGLDRAALRVETEEGPRLRIAVCGTGVAVSICVEPEPLEFGPVAERNPFTKTLRLVSCGEEPLRITGVDIADDADHPLNPDFTFAPVTGLGRDLPVGEGLDVQVTFTPTTQGAAQGWLRVDSNAPLTPQVFAALVGEGAPPCRLAAVPERLRFLGVPIGGTDVRQALVVNDEVTACRVPRIEVIGPDAAQFGVVTTTPLILEPGNAAPIAVQYQPTQPGVTHTATLEFETDGRYISQVELLGNPTQAGGCQLDVRPAFMNFGAVTAGESDRRGVSVQNLSNQPCQVTGTSWASGGSAQFSVLSTLPQTVVAGASMTVEVEYAPAREGIDRAVLQIATSDTDDPQFDVPVFGAARQPLICVSPTDIDFGQTSVTQTRGVTVTACGAQAVTVSNVDFIQPDAEYTVVPPMALPWTIPPGSSVVFDVRYSPVDEFADWGTIAVRSDDPLRPIVPVTLRGGPNEFPPEVGQNLYVWQLGTVVRFPLQGGLPGVPFYGQQTGQGCSGCHAVSPDGRYVALIDYPNFTMVDTMTNLTVPTGVVGQVDSVSWNPDVNTTPSHQFVYADSFGAIQKASISGPIGPLAGASDTTMAQRMPSWGPNGQIVFARAPLATSSGPAFGFQGPVDLMLVPESGGVPVPVIGASGTAAAHYYPAFASNGDWIAFTYSASAITTYAAADGQMRLVRANQSGTVQTLPQVNTGGSASYPSWSLDGRILSFSSNRVGGLGDWDIYVATIDPITGMSGPAQPLAGVNTSSFDHLAVWAR